VLASELVAAFGHLFGGQQFGTQRRFAEPHPRAALARLARRERRA
jgi:hypothetical protein